MEPILVDTSVWIDWFSERGRNTLQTDILEQCFNQNRPICITAVVLQEVMQGIRDDKLFEQIKAELLACIVLQLDPVKAAIDAAILYRLLRKKGVTIRKPNDCLIAQYAIFHNLPILHNDADFTQITLYTTLRTTDEALR